MAFLDNNGVTTLVTRLKTYFALKNDVPGAFIGNPQMDGTASAGSGTSYARGNHVHPHDTSKQDKLVSGTNIKTINNKSLLGSGNISIVNEAEEFTGTRSNAIYRGECFGTYDPNSNSVTLIYHFYHNSDIPISYTLFTIPEKYRPTTTKYGGAFYTVGSSWISYNGYVTSGGIVKQDVSGSCRGGFGVIKYILN